jgi:hypothetical protein
MTGAELGNRQIFYDGATREYGNPEVELDSRYQVVGDINNRGAMVTVVPPPTFGRRRVIVSLLLRSSIAVAQWLNVMSSTYPP